jgi:hypothetical protein
MQNKDKRQKKKDTGSSPNTNASPYGPAPMQIALTRFSKGVDVKRFLQDCRQKTNGAAKKYLPAMFEEQSAAVAAGKLYAPDNPVIPDNSTQMGTSKDDTEPDMAAKVLISNQEDCNPTSMKAAALLLAEPRSVQPSNYRVSSSEFQCPTSKKLEAASGSKDNKVGELASLNSYQY